MKFPFALFAILCAGFVLPRPVHANLLLNGDFETLVSGTVLGSNHPITVPDWAVAATAGGANNTSLTNLVLGTATGTQSNGSNTKLPSYQDDGSTTHNQSLDGVNATVYATQTFVLDTASPLFVSAAFGGRDYSSGSTAAGNLSNWTITGTDTGPGGNSTYTASGTGTAPTFGQWAVDSATTALAPAGDYLMTVTLANPDQVDAVTVTPVPEPSAALAAAAGGLGLLLGRRFRRARGR